MTDIKPFYYSSLERGGIQEKTCQTLSLSTVVLLEVQQERGDKGKKHETLSLSTAVLLEVTKERGDKGKKHDRH